MSLARWLVLAVVSSLMIWSIPPFPAQADAGDLDPTFGIGGRVTTDFGANERLDNIAIQSDGKILAVGGSNLVRYNANGSLDSEFGSSGRVITDFFPKSVAMRADGKIVVAGSATVAQYHPNGTADVAFGSGGKVIAAIGDLKNMQIQPDGKIIVVSHRGGMARLNPDGSSDTTFGSGGIVYASTVATPVGNVIPFIEGIALQTNGRIVLAGFADSHDLCSISALARYNTDGTPDSSFGSGGWVFTSFEVPGRAVRVALQRDGKIVIAAAKITPDCDHTVGFALARYNIDGSLDSTFGTAGTVNPDASPLAINEADAGLVIQSNGKIVVGGYSVTNTNTFGFALARYNPDGTLDSMFGSGGSVVTAFQDVRAFINAIALQADGRLVAAGTAYAPYPDCGVPCPGDFVLARYEGDPPFDLCLQDDTSGNLLLFNSLTGDYLFTVCPASDSRFFMLFGTATITRTRCVMRLEDVSHRSYRLSATVLTCRGAGTAAMTLYDAAGDTRTFTISDRNIRINTCACH